MSAAIAILGGGLTGLTTAWLLDGQGEATLFEKEERLGGNFHTVSFAGRDGAHHVDIGAQVFPREIYPAFFTLLEELGCRVIEMRQGVSIHDPKRCRTLVVPTIHPRRLDSLSHWWSLRHLVSLEMTLKAIRALDEADDWHTSFAELIERQGLSFEFCNDVILPLGSALTNAWPEKDILSLSARAVLYYPAMVHKPHALGTYATTRIEGGTRTIVNALSSALTNTRLRTGVGVTSIVRRGRSLRLRDDEGHILGDFDRVVVATPAEPASRLVASLPWTEELKTALDEMTYQPTTVVVHDDPRFMPPRRSDWSPWSVLAGENASVGTTWYREKGRDVFKTFCTDTAPPQNPDALVEFRHVMLRPRHFAAQRRLPRFQGIGGLYLAGSHMRGFDNAESAVCSAIAIAQMIGPHAPRVRRMMNGIAQPQTIRYPSRDGGSEPTSRARAGPGDHARRL